MLLVAMRDHDNQASPTEYDAKIIDFGFIQEETTPLGHHIKGTVPYIAPEVLTGSFADRRSDLYSAGISIIQSISGHFPFPVDSMESWVNSLKETEDMPIESILADIPEDLLDLLKGLTKLDPERRISTSAEVLSHLEKMGGTPILDKPWVTRARIPTVGWERQLELIRNEMDDLRMGE